MLRNSKYILPMFPYPSGQLHLGHFRNYQLADAIARFCMVYHKTNITHAIGWDAFGLPAENAANNHGMAPAEWVLINPNRIRLCAI